MIYELIGSVDDLGGSRTVCMFMHALADCQHLIILATQMSRRVEFRSRDVELQIVEQRSRVHMNQVKAPTWRKVEAGGGFGGGV